MEESFKNFPYMQVGIFRQFLLYSHHTASPFVLQLFDEKRIKTVYTHKKTASIRYLTILIFPFFRLHTRSKSASKSLFW